MKITRDKMFFSKDLIHTLAYVGMFVEREEVFGVSLFTAIQSWLCGFLPVNFLKG